jgi:hypothetical protein
MGLNDFAGAAPADVFRTAGNVRIPIYPATHSDMKAATRSDFKPVSVPI